VVTARAGKIPVVCVQPLLVRRAREGEDFTRSRSDFGDAVIIARLTAGLRCYVPYLPEGPWARLRHLGARREGLIGRCVAAREQVRDLLECAWPAVLETAAEPLESLTWRAALAVSVDPAVITAMSDGQFLTAVRGQLAVLGGKKLWHRIAAAVHAAAADPGGIAAEREAILERAAFAYRDWMGALAALADTESGMLAVLDELDLSAAHVPQSGGGLCSLQGHLGPGGHHQPAGGASTNSAVGRITGFGGQFTQRVSLPVSRKNLSVHTLCSADGHDVDPVDLFLLVSKTRLDAAYQ
jgi:Transposase